MTETKLAGKSQSAGPVGQARAPGSSPGAPGSSPEAHGSSPEAHGSSPEAHGSSPAAHDSSPEAHDSSLEAHDSSTESRRSVVTECDLAEAPDKFWKALTVPKLLAAWLPDAVDSEILAAEPNRLLQYRWAGREEDRDERGRRLESVVTFELTGTESGGTHLRVVHRVVGASSRVIAFRGRREPFGMLSPPERGSGSVPYAQGSGSWRAHCALASGSGEGEALRWAA